MKKHSLYITLIPIILVLLFIQPNSLSAENWSPPASLVGNWSGKHLVVLRTKKDGKFNYIKHPGAVNFSISINQNCKVSGSLGTAVFEDCIIQKNRGWIAKKLNLKTDYVIQGKLVGSIFPEDVIKNKIISMPINIENGRIKGSLFQIEGLIEMFPMVDVSLIKDKK